MGNLQRKTPVEDANVQQFHSEHTSYRRNRELPITWLGTEQMPVNVWKCLIVLYENNLVDVVRDWFWDRIFRSVFTSK